MLQKCEEVVFSEVFKPLFSLAKGNSTMALNLYLADQFSVSISGSENPKVDNIEKTFSSFSGLISGLLSDLSNLKASSSATERDDAGMEPSSTDVTGMAASVLFFHFSGQRSRGSC